MSEFSLIILVWLLGVSIVYCYPKLAGWLVLAGMPFYLVRFSILGIPSTLLELTIYAIFVAYLFKFGFGEIITPLTKHTWLVGAFGALMIGLVIGVWVSEDKTMSLGIAKGWFFDPALAGLILYRWWKDVNYRWTTLALGVVGGSLGGIAVWQWLTDNFVTLDGRASAVFSSANYLALFLGPIFVLGFGFLLATWRKREYWLVTLTSALEILILLGLLLSQSYASWVAVMVGVGWLLWREWKSLRWALPISVGLLGVLVSTQLHNPKFQLLLDFVDRSSSSVRLQVWQVALTMIKENPLTGIGLGRFQAEYPAVAERLFHPPLEWVMLHAHNLYLQFWLYFGVAGIAGLIWLIVGMVGLVAKAKSSLWVNAVSGALIVQLVHGLFDLPFWKNDLAVLGVSLIFAMLFLYDQQTNKT